MPLFEQKLISPLAIRFTQEHIRTTFRDGRILESSYKQIQFQPGTGDYDILLEAPFPNIEIIRWHPPRHSKEPREADHWFTLDNRRLYCLQRAAADHWPRRVAVVVDLLYADPGTVFKKYDSSSRGRSVTIGHSFKGPVLCRWDWRSQASASCWGADEAFEALAVDDGRGEVAALQDAPEEPCSLLALALAGELGALAEPGKAGGSGEPGCSTPSTADSSEEDSEAAAGRAAPAAVEEAIHALRKGLGEDDEAEEAARLSDEAAAEVERQLLTPGNKGFVWVNSWNQRYLRRLGMLRSFIESKPDRFVVHPGRGRGYTVSLASREAPAARPAGAPAARRWAPRPSAAPQKRWVVAGGGA